MKSLICGILYRMIQYIIRGMFHYWLCFPKVKFEVQITLVSISQQDIQDYSLPYKVNSSISIRKLKQTKNLSSVHFS